MKLFVHFLILFFIYFHFGIYAQKTPKREFRGAWIQTVHQSQYQGKTRSELETLFTRMLDQLQDAGINAIIFQVRPSADAFYASSLEPWSRFLSGKQGWFCESDFDPMTFLINACHERNMEFHAWLNPFRVTTNSKDSLSSNHIFFQHPEWFVSYDGKIYFDPGLPQSRKFIRSVIKDIISRYDVDAIHMDDYFYPYPVKGLNFPDDQSFNTYHAMMGLGADEKDKWRRRNVNILIKSIHEDIQSIKPWVRFGISPFGIYRNKSNDPSGSDTHGLQNYDDLYADILLWAEQGWIDYLVPQLYWEIGHPAADYETLIHWWSENVTSCPLYIGQSISRSLDDKRPLTFSDTHFNKKITLSRELPHIEGNCFWYGYQICNNEDGIETVLQNKYHKHPALIPSNSKRIYKGPREVYRLKARWTEKGYELSWKNHQEKDSILTSKYYCIYRFPKGIRKDLNNTDYLLGTTRKNYYLLPYDKGKNAFTYVITAVDRIHNESKKGKSKNVKL